MRTGAFFFGQVEMDDVGAGPPAPTDRRYDGKAQWAALERLLDAGVAAERAGYDSFWLTEHHLCSTSSPSGTRSSWPRTSP
jgi:alkanesulfonate monooxygenase SsuD/methylene tetrahydromethanopterin reductase-like flavin-dependent oxidoreductase (luciferase family)